MITVNKEITRKGDLIMIITNNIIKINPDFYYFIKIESDGAELIIVLFSGAIYLHKNNNKQIKSNQLQVIYTVFCSHCRGSRYIYFDTLFSLFSLFITHPKSEWVINIPKLNGIIDWGSIVALKNDHLPPILINMQ